MVLGTENDVPSAPQARIRIPSAFDKSDIPVDANVIERLMEGKALVVDEISTCHHAQARQSETT
jgi:hypothetical protein